MKFVCLVCLEDDKLRTMPDRECKACGDDMKARGILVAAEALQPVRTARTVRVRHGKPVITDGPFTETKEMLAGFYLIDATDQDEAMRIAAAIPPARGEASKCGR